MDNIVYIVHYILCVYSIEGPTYRVHYISNRMMCSGHTKSPVLGFYFEFVVGKRHQYFLGYSPIKIVK